MPDTLYFTIDQVAKHNKKENCWIIIDDFICDITHFLNKHPGSSAILLGYAGKNASDIYHRLQHSNTAFNIVKELSIGKLCHIEDHL